MRTLSGISFTDFVLNQNVYVKQKRTSNKVVVECYNQSKICTLFKVTGIHLPMCVLELNHLKINIVAIHVMGLSGKVEELGS